MPSRLPTPGEMPQVTPRDLHATSDIRFVIVEIGKLTANVDRLLEGNRDAAVALKEHSESVNVRISEIEKAILKARTAFYVSALILALLLPAFGGIMWWALGERVSSLLTQAPPQSQSAAPP